MPASSSPRFSVADEAFLRRLERLSIEARRSLRGMPSGGEHPSRQQLPATIFSDHRPYSAGDDYRSIDWNAYARQEQFVVKLGETEQTINVHLLLDLSRSMAWGTPPKLLAARQLIAALGYLALAHSDRLRITPFSAGLLPSFGPSQSKLRTTDMLRFVDALQPAARTSLAGSLGAYARTAEQGGLLVVCSDLLTEPAEGLAEGLRLFRPPRWQALVLHILDPRELQPDLSGPIELEDAETGERLPLTVDDEAIAVYRRNLATWQQGLTGACARSGAAYVQVLSSWPIEKQVIPYLRARQILS